MRQTRIRFYSRLLLIIVTITCFEHCKEKTSLPKSDPGNGGLILPKNFEALVVVDSIGKKKFAKPIRRNKTI